MAKWSNREHRHPELVDSPRERRQFPRLQPIAGVPGLPSEAARGLPRLRLRVEPQIPQLVRGLVAIAADPASLAREGGAAPSLNRRRRAATAWLRAILDGAIDPSTLRDVAEILLPNLVGGGRAAAQARARICVDYLRGALTGLVMARPEDNLVPEARALFALDTILAAHLGAVLGVPAAPETPPARAAKVRV